MISRWPDEDLSSARSQGDPPADAFMAALLDRTRGAQGPSRGGYNHLLDLATALVTHPGLALIRDGQGLEGDRIRASALYTELGDCGEMAALFNPILAPDWVDEDKLKLASRLWEQDSLLCIAVLYAASLPACYLMAKGVPALYATDKLADQTYIFQRIFETGLMLESVMQAGGINLLHDVPPNADGTLAAVLNRLDPAGRWAWQRHRLCRGAGPGGPALDPALVRRTYAEAMEPTRYLWGPGIVAAQKVRLLHAAIRCMLEQPRPAEGSATDKPRTFSEAASRRQAQWDTATLGRPINQEDLAFVLLTFGYLIPKGMETWGRKVPREQREAFLHLWRVVGHVMGLDPKFVTDDLDEAAVLYEQILARNEGATADGQTLTTAVMDFLRSYIWDRLGLLKFVPAMLIIDQLGHRRAKLVINETEYRAATRPLPRLTHALVRLMVRLGFWVGRTVLRFVPMARVTLGRLTEPASEALIDSWRDSFRRKPFYVPAEATTWTPDRGVTPEYKASLMHWRRKLFDTIVVGLGELIASAVGAIVTFVFSVRHMPTEHNVALGLTIILFLLGTATLGLKVPKVAKLRPTLDDTPESLAEGNLATGFPESGTDTPVTGLPGSPAPAAESAGDVAPT